MDWKQTIAVFPDILASYQCQHTNFILSTSCVFPSDSSIGTNLFLVCCYFWSLSVIIYVYKIYVKWFWLSFFFFCIPTWLIGICCVFAIYNVVLYQIYFLWISSFAFDSFICICVCVRVCCGCHMCRNAKRIFYL